MPITFKCSECGKAYRVKTELAGKRFKCKGCGEPLQVPQTEQEPIDDSTGSGYLFIGLASLVIVGCVAAIFIFNPFGEKTPATGNELGKLEQPNNDEEVPPAVILTDKEINKFADTLMNADKTVANRQAAAKMLVGQGKRAKSLLLSGLRKGLKTNELMKFCAEELEKSGDQSSGTLKALMIANERVGTLFQNSGRAERRKPTRTTTKRDINAVGESTIASKTSRRLKEQAEQRRAGKKANQEWGPTINAIYSAINTLTPPPESDPPATLALLHCRNYTLPAAKKVKLDDKPVDISMLLKILRADTAKDVPILIFMKTSRLNEYTTERTNYLRGALYLLGQMGEKARSVIPDLFGMLYVKGNLYFQVRSDIEKTIKKIDTNSSIAESYPEIASNSQSKHKYLFKYSLKSLLLILNDENTHQHRSKIVLALSELGTTGREAVPVLIKMLSSEDEMQQHVAARGLALIVDQLSPDLITVILDVLHKGQLPAESQLGLCWLLINRSDFDKDLKESLDPTLTKLSEISELPQEEGELAELMNKKGVPDRKLRLKNLKEIADGLRNNQIPIKTTEPQFELIQELVIDPSKIFKKPFYDVSLSSNGRWLSFHKVIKRRQKRGYESINPFQVWDLQNGQPLLIINTARSVNLSDDGENLIIETMKYKSRTLQIEAWNREAIKNSGKYSRKNLKTITPSTRKLIEPWLNKSGKIIIKDDSSLPLYMPKRLQSQYVLNEPTSFLKYTKENLNCSFTFHEFDKLKDWRKSMNRYVTRSNDVILAHHDSPFVIWSPTAKQVEKQLNYLPLKPIEDEILSMTIAEDSMDIICSTKEGFYVANLLKSGKIHKLKNPPGPEDSLVNWTEIPFDIPLDRELSNIGGKRPAKLRGKLSADGRVYSICGRGVARFWDLSKNQLISKLPEPTIAVDRTKVVEWLTLQDDRLNRPIGVSLSPTGETVAVITIGGSVHLYDTHTMNLLVTLYDASGSRLKDDGIYFVGHKEPRSYTFNYNYTFDKNRTDKNPDFGVQFSSDGSTLAAWGVNGKNGTIHVWRKKTGK
jgi:hypothetical protein